MDWMRSIQKISCGGRMLKHFCIAVAVIALILHPAVSAQETVEEPAEEERVISERLVELYESNPELIGWLEVGDKISEPVVYRDNAFYLDHDFYGKESLYGTVFADEKNVNWETDSYIILYGHNMRDGSIFGTLDNFQYLDHLIENCVINYYPLYDDEVWQFVPFAIVDASMQKDHPTYFKLRNFKAFRMDEDPEERDLSEAEAFVADLIERSLYEIPGIDATAEDRILGMTTCSYKYPDGRLTVFCRQLREGETIEALVEHIRINARQK